jgi:hypothetical protein
LVQISDRHPHALAHEGGCGGATDSTGGTGDRRGLAGKNAGLLCHEFLLIGPADVGSA